MMKLRATLVAGAAAAIAGTALAATSHAPPPLRAWRTSAHALKVASARPVVSAITTTLDCQS